uniref:Thioredoxin domain-containing protein n=1 Tax=Spongospora subterranea TaxID=70186 RepID=A0A0H5REI5_9EUKA|eukprot:CRZ12423.1 hypothetical protein [Spongospora subterranea]
MIYSLIFVKSLSVTLLKRLRFGHLLSSEKESVLKVGVTKFPSLIAFRTGEANPITFDKDLADTVAVKSFLNSVSLPPDISSLSIFNISDNSCLRKYCMDSGAQVCVLGLNPGAGGSVALAALDEASTSIPNRQWYSFGWIDARKQASFSGSFGVIPDAFKIVIWFHRKMKYVVYTGSMDADVSCLLILASIALNAFCSEYHQIYFLGCHWQISAIDT